MSRAAAAALAALVLLVEAQPARAFCLARTCDPADPKQECELDSDDCPTQGKVLHWTSGCVTFAIQSDGSRKRGLDADDVRSVSERAFRTWLNADCGDDGPSMMIGSLGPVVCNESRHNPHGRNANIVMFRDDEWPYPGSIDSYGLTTVRFNRETGEIYDADVELNSADVDIRIDAAQNGVDLESILAHEFGHFLGLGHAAPEDEVSTMRVSWEGQGLDLRSLSEDDTAGICAAYPPGRRASSSCTPHNGFASECNVPVDELDGGCALSPPTNERHSASGLVLAALASVLSGARRRTRRPGARS